MLGEGLCPNRHGWTFCPTRARPSWIIRGACPLHDLMEVRMEEEEKKEEGKNTCECDNIRKCDNICECNTKFFVKKHSRR
jgi:hypothetical protein